jgi:CubicO group peptidase (beta-lactamase class C family)
MRNKFHCSAAVTLIVLMITQSAFAQSQASTATLPTAAPSAVGMSPTQLTYIDQIVEAEIAKKQLPGAVVLVGRQGKIVWRRAYGNRALEPQPEPMTVDTIFDLASLTKIVATATSVMILVERGLVRLGDPVSRYIPEFAESGKRAITVEHLLVHRSGLIADNDIKDYEHGPEKAMENIWRLAPLNEAGAKFIYSDVNFIVLAELVKRVSGKPVDQFALENIYQPLGMKDTGYKPLERLGAQVQSRIAPTEQRGGPDQNRNREGAAKEGEVVAKDAEHWMRGEVHDPRSYLLGGVAGHAGLFSTADDLAIYCQMILNGGDYQGRRILSPMGVQRMTEARPSAGNASDSNVRGLGWDIYSGFSANRGDLLPIGSFGHTGFTGTGLWLDPASETFVVFLSNRVHPKLDPKKPADVSSLRGRVASVVASAITLAPFSGKGTNRPNDGPLTGRQFDKLVPLASASPLSQTLNGIDVLKRDGFALLKGKRVGLITNHTGRDRDGNPTIDVLHKAPDMKLVALFSPEHGIRGALDQEKITNTTDEKTGLPVFSLYGETRKPTAEMLKDIDVLVFDIQDIGARFYTYVSTMGLAMEVAAKNGKTFVVLDRVNPINGIDVDGPLADGDKLSFIAHHQIPVRHGMTVGELAQLFNKERAINADLHIVRVEDWKRSQWFDETGLTWINPSPNMRSLAEATLYPGVGLIETTNVSVGRGTDTPFEPARRAIRACAVYAESQRSQRCRMRRR